ncbi:MAG TPA: hypothetical protein PK323_12500 [Bacteroidia bacterium]|nr:hypothetical protein [Bacteroidia bacterium]
MKKLTQSVLAILVVASAFTSCKKGEGDPTISLRSRTSRVAGEWKISSEETKSDWTSMVTGSAATSGSSLMKFTGTTYSGTNTSGTVTTTASGTVTENSMTFEKDGTFTSKKIYTVKDTETEDYAGAGTLTTVTTTDYSMSSEGVWNFLGKVQADTKNKEEMSVSVTKTNNTITTKRVYTFKYLSSLGFPDETWSETSSEVETSSDEPNENVMVMKITTLKNKEMVVESVGKSTYNSTMNSSETDIDGITTTDPTTVYSMTSNNTTNITMEQD